MTAERVYLLVALLVMVSFVLFPGRSRRWRPVAVIGWALVWADGGISLGVLDRTGLALVVVSLGFVVAHRRGAGSDDHAPLDA